MKTQLALLVATGNRIAPESSLPVIVNFLYGWQTRNGRNIRGPVQRPIRGAEEVYMREGGDNEGRGFVWPPRTMVDIEQMLQEAYARADEVNAAAYENGEEETPLEDLGSTEGMDTNVQDFADLLQESREPVYEGCKQSRMQSANDTGKSLLCVTQLHGCPAEIFRRGFIAIFELSATKHI